MWRTEARDIQTPDESGYNELVVPVAQTFLSVRSKQRPLQYSQASVQRKLDDSFIQLSGNTHSVLRCATKFSLRSLPTIRGLCLP